LQVDGSFGPKITAISPLMTVSATPDPVLIATSCAVAGWSATETATSADAVAGALTSTPAVTAKRTFRIILLPFAFRLIANCSLPSTLMNRSQSAVSVAAITGLELLLTRRFVTRVISATLAADARRCRGDDGTAARLHQFGYV
jgi:hypothetical protein